MPLSVKLSSPSGPGQTEAGRYPVFLLTEPWALFHRRFPLSLPLSSALLSHPETDHLRQWDESRQAGETKRELLENPPPPPDPASALVSLMGVRVIRSMIGYLRCRSPSWIAAFMRYGNTRSFHTSVQRNDLSVLSAAKKRGCFLMIVFLILNTLTLYNHSSDILM